MRLVETMILDLKFSQNVLKSLSKIMFFPKLKIILGNFKFDFMTN